MWGTTTRNPLLLKSAPDAFQSVIGISKAPDLATLNLLEADAEALWTTYSQRINPLFKVMFEWDLGNLASTRLSSPSTPLDVTKAALVSSIYLASVVSLTDSECRTIFGHPKSSLLPDCQRLCEEAIVRTNILCMKNIQSLKALAIYLVSHAST